MELELITEKQRLLSYRDQILGLFERCFERVLSPAIWQWAYINNPCGNPIVSLCLVDGEVVGHYAVIPLTLWQEEHALKTVLSMTTMVDPVMQGQGLFIKQANHVYDYLAEHAYDYVLGFPNKNSLPGFKKHLQWQLDEHDYVAKVTKADLIASQDLQAYLQQKQDIRFNPNDVAVMSWRLAKPECDYQQRPHTAIKHYKTSIDIMSMTTDSFAELEDDLTYHLLCDASIKDLLPHKAFDYPFGYRSFKQVKQASFKKDLLLSDVF